MREEQYLRYNILKQCAYDIDKAAKALEFIDIKELGSVKAYAVTDSEAVGQVYKNFKPQSIKYEVGKTYKTDWAIIGKDGFHAFRDIKDLLYEWLEYGNTRIFEVELNGMVDYGIKRNIVCGSDMIVLRELSIGEAAEICGGYFLMAQNKKPVLIDKNESAIDDKEMVRTYLVTVCGYLMCNDGENITYMDGDDNVVYQHSKGED